MVNLFPIDEYKRWLVDEPFTKDKSGPLGCAKSVYILNKSV